jgi:hypothetical protein
MNRSEARKLVWQRPGFREARIEEAKVRHQDPEYQAKLYQPRKEGTGENISAGLKAYFREHPEARENISVRRKKWISEHWEEFVAKVLERAWAGYRAVPYEVKVARAHLARQGKRSAPNKLELRAAQLLGDDFVYVGNGTVIIDGLSPDFIHILQPLVVEVYGRHWHEGQNPQDRIDAFAKRGYACAVFWDCEIHV